jgi:hypothetical protein
LADPKLLSPSVAATAAVGEGFMGEAASAVGAGFMAVRDLVDAADFAVERASVGARFVADLVFTAVMASAGALVAEVSAAAFAAVAFVAEAFAVVGVGADGEAGEIGTGVGA